MSTLSPRLILALSGLACAAAVGGALISQHHFGMLPCPWCILQRMIFMVLAVWLLVAAALPWSGLRRAMAGLAVLLAGSGVAAALYQHFVAAKLNSCALTLADRIITATGLDLRWPDVFEVKASCADAAVSLLGVPYEFWALALFALVGVLALVSALARPGHARS